jgi:hypothetical protein
MAEVLPAKTVHPTPGAAAAAAAAGVHYELTIPPGYTIAPERMSALHSLLREAKVDPEHAEKLWAMHLDAMKQLLDHALQAQHDAFAEYRRAERNKIASDPEVGGAGFETSKAAARRVLDLATHGGTQEKTAANAAELEAWLKHSGATDSPALFKALVRLARVLDELQSAVAAQEEQRDQPATTSPVAGRRLRYAHRR